MVADDRLPFGSALCSIPELEARTGGYPHRKGQKWLQFACSPKVYDAPQEAWLRHHVCSVIGKTIILRSSAPVSAGFRVQGTDLRTDGAFLYRRELVEDQHGLPQSFGRGRAVFAWLPNSVGSCGAEEHWNT